MFDLPFADLAGKKWQLQDQLSSASYEWNGDDLQRKGTLSWIWLHGRLPFSLW